MIKNKLRVLSLRSAYLQLSFQMDVIHTTSSSVAIAATFDGLYIKLLLTIIKVY